MYPSFTVSSIEYDTGANLLARSLTLLDQPGGVVQPLLRWYLPTDTSIVLGRGQQVTRNLPNVAVVTRPSGGGAVLLNSTLLSVDVYLPPDHQWVNPANMSASFLPVGLSFKLALEQLGITGLQIFTDASQATRLGDRKEAMIASVCYASMGRGELHVAPVEETQLALRKLVGLSQRQRRHGTLIQCGILHVWEPQPIIDSLAVESIADYINQAAIGLDDLTKTPISDETLRAVISESFVSVANMPNWEKLL